MFGVSGLGAVLKSRFGTRFSLLLGAWRVMLGACGEVHGAWCSVCNVRCMLYDALCLVLPTVLVPVA